MKRKLTRLSRPYAAALHKYFIVSPKELHPVSREVQPLSVYLGALGMTGITRRVGAFTAVDSLIRSVNAGEVFGLLGSNGAGKTTMIQMLATLLSGAISQEVIDVLAVLNALRPEFLPKVIFNP